MSQHQEQAKHHSRLFGYIALGVFGMSVIIAIFAMGNSISEIRTAEIAKSPEIILANSGAKENHTIALPVTYYDQVSDECVELYDMAYRDALYERQFEWTGCGYYSKKLEQGLVESELSDEGLPVAVEGKLTPNRGLDFTQWFSSVDGKSAEATGTLQLVYSADGANFSFAADDFYPLDDIDFSANDPINADGHNHLFTMNFNVPFTVLASGEEVFTLTADDDTFVYLDDELVLDMGGIHHPMSAGITISQDGEVYTSVGGEDWQETNLKLAAGDTATLKVFHADRDSAESVFELNFSGMDLELASGTQIAASGTETDDSTYIAPLGETKVFQPDSARSLMIIATIEAVVIVASAVMVMIVARFILRQKMQR